MSANAVAYEVPLVELLERVPKDARFWAEEKHSSMHYPVGRISHQAADMLRQLQDKLDIETAYNQVHIEQIEALKSALNDILNNDGSRRIYSAGALYDARVKAEKLLAETGN